MARKNHVVVGLLLVMITTCLAQEGVLSTRQLPRSTRPVETPPGMNNANILSVSESRTKGEKMPTRVFRYQFRGNFAQWVRAYRSRLGGAWEYEALGNDEFDFWRKPKAGPIEMQALLIVNARLHRDPRSPFGWSPLPQKLSRGWIWVSYDERLRR